MPFPERKSAAHRHPWTLPQVSEADEFTRPITHPSPGDYMTTSAAARTMGRVGLARWKQECYEDVFSVRGADKNVLRERIRSDSIVLLELKTNVIIGDEFIFITELSAKLAERYQRPLSSIAVHVLHSQCIFYAGTFEPAYVATVSALAPYVQPAPNRRNTLVLAEHLEEALGVPPPRGFITFVPLAEGNAACNGKTIAQALESLDGMGVIDEEKAVSLGSRKKRLSVKSLSNIRTTMATAVGEITPPTSADDASPVGDDKPVKVARRRKSFVAGLFGRSHVKKENEKPSA